MFDGEAAISFEDSTSSMGTAEKHDSLDSSLVTTSCCAIAELRTPSIAFRSRLIHVS